MSPYRFYSCWKVSQNSKKYNKIISNIFIFIAQSVLYVMYVSVCVCVWYPLHTIVHKYEMYFPTLCTQNCDEWIINNKLNLYGCLVVVCVCFYFFGKNYWNIHKLCDNVFKTCPQTFIEWLKFNWFSFGFRVCCCYCCDINRIDYFDGTQLLTALWTWSYLRVCVCKCVCQMSLNIFHKVLSPCVCAAFIKSRQTGAILVIFPIKYSLIYILMFWK